MSTFCDQCGAEIYTDDDVGLVLPYTDRFRIGDSVFRVRRCQIICRGCQDDAEYMLRAIAGSDAGAAEIEFNRSAEEACRTAPRK